MRRCQFAVGDLGQKLSCFRRIHRSSKACRYLERDVRQVVNVESTSRKADVGFVSNSMFTGVGKKVTVLYIIFRVEASLRTSKSDVDREQKFQIPG